MKTVLYHGDADGFASAFALWLLFGDEATYVPVQYGQKVPELSEDTAQLYIVDFSYPRAVCVDLAEVYDLYIYDHHKSAEQELAGLPYAWFDKTKSGCGIVWERFHSGEEMPDLLKYVQDRDLWKFELPASEEVNLFISTLDRDFREWIRECFSSVFFADALRAGAAIKKFRDTQIGYSLRGVRMMQLSIEGVSYEVPAVNCTSNISEVGNELCIKYPGAPFAATYFDGDVFRHWSLRSKGEFDVSVIAKAYGGGGHRNAAGFHTEIGWPQYDSDEFLKAWTTATK